MFGKRSYVGLDIGHYAIKAVQIERTQSGWRITKRSSCQTPNDSVRDGIVLDAEAVGGAIKQMLKTATISATAAVIAVAGGTVVVRTVKMPKMAEAALRRYIKIEASRYVPSSVEDSFIECEILGPSGEQQMDVLIVAAPKELVQSRLRACEAAGLDVDVVDVEAFAMFRSLIEADTNADWQNDTMALIDVGAATTTVSVVTKGVFAMTRSIPQGGTTLTESLRTYFKLTPEDAESGKLQLDFRDLMKEDGPKENPPLRILQPIMDELVREIRRSLNYYQSQQTDSGQPNPVQRIVVTGGGAQLTGFSEYMSEKLGIPVLSSGVFDNPRFVFGGIDEPGQGLDLSVASGLAMRAFSKAA